MGSFDVQCCVSGLGISPGDECYITIGTSSPFKEYGCDTTGFCQPLRVFVKGIYEDYGRFELNEPNTYPYKFLEKTLQRIMGNKEKLKANIDQIGERRDPTVVKLDDKELNLYVVAVHKKVWDNLLKVKFKKSYQTSEMKFKTDQIKLVKPYLKKALALAKKDKNPYWARSLYDSGLEEAVDKGRGLCHLAWILCHSRYTHSWVFNDLMREACDNFINGTCSLDEYLSLCQQWIEYDWVDWNMRLIGKSWLPLQNMGLQCSEHKLSVEVFKSFVKSAKELER